MRLFHRLIISTAILTSASAVSSQLECVDSPLEFAYGNKGKRATCKDIGGKIDRRKCEESYFASHCPETCAKCEDRCIDSQAVFYNYGVARFCGWLDFLTDDKKEQRCSSRFISQTCPKMCGTCNRHVIDFDEVEVEQIETYEIHEESKMLFLGIQAFNASLFESYFEEELGKEFPFAEIAVSKPNAALTQGSSLFVCWGGNFDALSMYLAPLNIENVATTKITLNGYEINDTEMTIVATHDVEFSDDPNEVIHVELPSTFTRITAVEMVHEDMTFGFDNIEININSPCEDFPYYGNRDQFVSLFENKHV